MKDSFVLYTRYAKHIEKLTDEQCGVLFRAIMAHATGDELPEMDVTTDLIYGIIVEDIEECDRKWQEVKEKRSKAGRASAEKRQQKATSHEQDLTQSNTNEQTPTDSTVYVNVNVNGLKEKENKKKKKAKDDADFEALWELYPRKNGKKDAKRHYMSAVADGATYEEVRRGIEAYKNYIEKTGTGSKYVKMGSSFFHQRSWADDWTVPKDESQNTVEPKRYKEFETQEYEKEDFKAEQMPDEIRNRLSGMFGS